MDAERFIAQRWIKRQAENKSWAMRQALAAAAAEHPDPIDLNKGDPDLDTPPNIVEAGIRALQEGKTHYTSPTGLPALREAIARKLGNENQIPTQPSQVIVTSGVMQALTISLQGLVEPGDEVILGDPVYPAHVVAILLAGGTPVLVPARAENRFVPTVEDVKAHLTPRTKALIIVTPSNPGGAVFSRDALEATAQLVQERDLFVLSDEIYEKYVYDDTLQHISIASLPGMADRTLTINGFSKTYCMTGWRLGYVAGPAEVISYLGEIRLAHSICASSIAQYGGLEALSDRTVPYVQNIVETFGERRRFVLQSLEDMGLEHNNPPGTYFVLANTVGTGMTSFEFALHLVEQTGVHVWPGAMFGNAIDEYVRIGLVQPLERLEEAMARMRRIMTEILDTNKGGQ